MLLGEYGRAHRYTKQSLEHLAVGFEPMAYMFARSGAALTYMMGGRWEAALREVDEAVATGAERSDAGIVSFCNAIGARWLPGSTGSMSTGSRRWRTSPARAVLPPLRKSRSAR